MVTDVRAPCPMSHNVCQVISGVFPYVGHVTNKKWPLNEEYNNHLVRMQQVQKIYIVNLNQTFRLVLKIC